MRNVTVHAVLRGTLSEVEAGPCTHNRNMHFRAASRVCTGYEPQNCAVLARVHGVRSRWAAESRGSEPRPLSAALHALQVPLNEGT